MSDSVALTDTLAAERAAPKPTSISEPFWTASRDRRLMIQYCTATGRYQFFPRPTSIFTGRRTLEWREVSGRGSLFAVTVTRRAPLPLRGQEPFLVATVTLDEGVNLLANLIRCAVKDARVGLRVKPFWAPLPDGTHLLMFEPDGA